jgi:hypothetical protein
MLSSSRFNASPVTVSPVVEAELQHLAGQRLGQAVDTGHPVLDLEDRPDLLEIRSRQVGGLDLAEQHVLELTGAQGGLVSHCRIAG